MSRASLVPSPFLWRLIAIVVSLATLGAAHAFETFGGYAPCGLCLHQREVYWTALGIGVVGSVLAWKVPKLSTPISLLLTLTFFVGMALAAYHSGVEWKWWPGPTSCTGPAGGVSGADMASLLAGAKIRPPSCDEAAWRMFGISMAGYNTLISAGLVVLGLWSSLKAKEARA